MRRTFGAISLFLILFLVAGCGTFHATTARDTPIDHASTKATLPSKSEGSHVSPREYLCTEILLWGPIGPLVYLMGFRLK